MGYDKDIYQEEQELICQTEVDLDATAGDKMVVAFNYDVTLTGFKFYIGSEALGQVLADGTAAQLSLDVTPQGGQRTELAAITMPKTQDLAAGDFGNWFSLGLDICGQTPVYFEHKTQAVAGDGGSAAGKGYMVLSYRKKFMVDSGGGMMMP